MEPGEFATTTGGDIEPGAVSRTDELSGHQQNLLTQGLERCVVKFLRQQSRLNQLMRL